MLSLWKRRHHHHHHRQQHHHHTWETSLRGRRYFNFSNVLLIKSSNLGERPCSILNPRTRDFYLRAYTGIYLFFLRARVTDYIYLCGIAVQCTLVAFDIYAPCFTSCSILKRPTLLSVLESMCTLVLSKFHAPLDNAGRTARVAVRRLKYHYRYTNKMRNKLVS